MNNYLRFIFISPLLILLLNGCENKFKLKEPLIQQIECSGETVVSGVFINGDHKFGGGAQQSNEFFRSGKHSCIANKKTPFALDYELDSVKKGDIIHAKIWMYNPDNSKTAQLVIADTSAAQYDVETFIDSTYGEWSLIKNTFEAINDYGLVKVYGFSNSEADVYFDDLSIIKMSAPPKPAVTDSTLRIYIPDHEMATLDSCLAAGRKSDILVKELKQYVRGFILQNGDSSPVKLRLKGDWTDHLRTSKYSLRIKVLGNNAFNGLKSFSIQNPQTRGMMLEWYMHKLCDEEDILTTRYEFINVEINGEVKGVYALEEHFDKQLLEARNRREGPIVKLDEDGKWQYTYALQYENQMVASPDFLSSSILPFKKNRTHRTRSLHEQFLVAQSNLSKYKSHAENPEQFLDLEDFAKYIALLDLGNIDHSLTWHNQRQYYNPVTAKLEPILFDCFQELKYLSRRRTFYLVDESVTEHRPTNLNVALLANEEFRTLYQSYVLNYADPVYFKNFKEKYASEIKANLELLNYEYPFYTSANEEALFETNARTLREGIDSLAAFLDQVEQINFEKDKWPVYPDTVDHFHSKIALKTFLESDTNGTKTLALQNFHQAGIRIIAYSTDSLPEELVLLKSPVEFSAFTSDVVTKYLDVPSAARHLYYAPQNLNGRVKKTKISKWPLPKDVDVRGEFTVLPAELNKDGALILKAGTYSFDKNVVVDNAQKLIMEAGVSIDLTKSAGFISYVPIEMKGTRENPIKIFSSDSTASGFNIIAKKGKSVLDYVQFDQLSSMNQNHWILTGAVTIYGGEVSISNCSFENNLSEDALNLIRTDFTITNILVSNTFSDGFDADFCTGSISDSKIFNTQNDGLDFSGSQIQVLNCELKNAGDKGISGGENSQLSINNTTIDSAFIGVASKDFSQIEISEIEISNCEYSYAAFRKKAEYGPASITVLSPKFNSENLLLDAGSEITFGSIVHSTDQNLNIDSLYLNW